MAAILGIVTSLVGPAIEIGKCIGVPIKRQFNYLCCFSSNVQNLRDEVKKLEDARVGLKMRVAAAKNNAEVILPQVKTWLENVNEIQMKMAGIESEITTTQSGGLSIKSRFLLSKKARKTAQVMRELRESCSFNLVSQPAPPASTVPVPLGTTFEFESRKHVEEEIMTTLRIKDVNMIGICGMGGVGKTTMVKRIMNRAREEGLFDEVVMIVVSQQANELKIQGDIAEQLGLTLEERSLPSRAHKLRIRLMCGKRILIILDDVWVNLKLEDLGIPCEEGCTIVLTSRDRDVLREMDAQKVCVVSTLSDVEAWSLFREKVGTCLDDPALLSTAQEIVKECKGLPLALVTVGVALKDRREEFIWEDALQQLKSSNPIDMPKVLEGVYKPLRLSYNSLESEHTKSLFLLCCLFREDATISLEHLTFFCWGLRVFEGIRSLRDARNRVRVLVEKLRSRFLLLDIESEDYVQMHDVVRDVAIFIASNKGLVPNFSFKTWPEGNSDCSWISSFQGEKAELLKELVLPNLRLLWIDRYADDEYQMNDDFFEGIRELNVLFICCRSLRRLPHTTCLLKNLRTLILDGCNSLETISVVGELENLEVLVCQFFESIEELPVEIKGLTHLKLLELSLCRKLKRIAPGVISSLVGLEELKMEMSFDKWEAETKEEGKQRENAALRELESLSHLTWLKIYVEDSTLASEEMSLSAKLAKFDVRIGKDIFSTLSSESFDKKICMKLSEDISLGNWINMLLRSSECLESTGDGSINLDLSLAQNTRSLTLNKCSTMKHVAKSVDWSSAAVFPFLQLLWLKKLANLEEICNGLISSDSFHSLKILKLEYLPALKQLWRSSNPYQNGVSLCSNLFSIYIYHCNSLPNLSSLSTAANDCLPQLERLVVEFCDMMEQVFLWNDEHQNRKHTALKFPKLKELVLSYLPRLTHFCNGIETIEFPQLTQFQIVSCPKMASLVPDIGHGDDGSIHLLCKPKIAFGRLKDVEIGGYGDISDTNLFWCHQIPVGFFLGLKILKISSFYNITSLFSSPIAQNLVKLRELEISYCFEMVKVIEDEEGEEDEEEEARHVCLFPRLREVKLKDLPELEIFCKWRCALELPSLETLEIHKCPQMERFTLGSIATPKLSRVIIDFVHLDAQDLNDVLLRKEELLKDWITSSEEEGEEESTSDIEELLDSMEEDEDDGEEEEEEEEEEGEGNDDDDDKEEKKVQEQ